MILDQIVENRRRELEDRKRCMPLKKIERKALSKPPPLDLASVLDRNGIQLIAEVKKASPSRGLICRNFNPVQIAKAYAENGAAAISVLTESRYFQGNLDYLGYIDAGLGDTRPPLLRKDFIFDPYQVFETRAFGADALLLIVAILSPGQLKGLLDLSHSLHLSCLVETHNEIEVQTALESGARIIGINNRDLNTFEVDIHTTERLSLLVPGDRILVSESGIKNRGDIEKMRNWRVNAVLVGESLLSSNDIKARMEELL